MEATETNEHLVPETNTSHVQAFFLSYVAIAIESIVAATCQHHAALIVIVILEIDTTLSSDFVVLFKTALTILCPLHSCFYVIQQ